MPQLRVGISGWTYPPWRGSFYPEDLAQKRELEFASRQVNSIEINGSFYSLQTPKSYRAWYDATPDDFRFSLKGGRFITHMKKLKDVETPLANFFASGVLALKEKLGPILWQFPPGFALNMERFEAFFHMLPRDTMAAAKLARRHDVRMKGRALTRCQIDRPLQHAVEIRHETFRTPEFVNLLRRHKIGLVVADTAGKWPFMEDVTADFVYVRLHGDEELYVSGYTPEALARWAQKVRAWRAGREPADAQRVAPAAKARAKGRDVYIYLDNDAKVHAPFDAMALATRVGLTRGDREEKFRPALAPGVAREHWPALQRASTRGA